jgi:hypothetical protein
MLETVIEQNLLTKDNLQILPHRAHGVLSSTRNDLPDVGIWERLAAIRAVQALQLQRRAQQEAEDRELALQIQVDMNPGAETVRNGLSQRRSRNLQGWAGVVSPFYRIQTKVPW